MMKRLAVLSLAIVLFTGWFPHGNQSLPTTPFQSMQLWGGGFPVGQDNLSGVKLVRTDSFGAYVCITNSNCAADNTSSWGQLITVNTFSLAVCNGGVAGSCFGYYPNTGLGQVFQGSPGGVIEICASPATPTTAYMFYGGLIFYTTNLSETNPDSTRWHNSNELVGGGFAKTTDGSNANNRMNGRFMACDPNNANHVLVATASNGIRETKDGASTFATISSSDIPTASATNGINYSIAFDQTSGVNGSNLTNTVYVFTNGTSPDVYVSTTGGGAGTWSPTSSGATAMQHMVVCADSALYAVTGAANSNASALLKYTGTWSTIIAASSNLHSIACNSSNANHLVGVTNGGQLRVSTTGSSGMSTILPFLLPFNAGDAPWQGTLAANIFSLTAGDVSIDASDNVIFDGGQGIWTVALPSTSFTWTPKVSGVMQPIGQQIVVPKALTAVAGYQDLASCTIVVGTPPTVCNPIAQLKGLEFASGLAVSVTDPTFMVARISEDFSGQSDYSGYSTDYFVNNYLPFNTWSTGAAGISASTAICNNTTASCGGTPGSGNLVRAVVPSTVGLTTWSAGSGSIVCTYATVVVLGNALTNGSTGTTCYPVTVVDSTHIDLQAAAFTTALTTIGGNYVIYAPPPTIYSSWGGAFNITGTSSDSGKIKISTMLADGTMMLTGMPVHITGVLGTTEANGDWILNSVSGSAHTFDLGPTSTFTNAYTGGGVASVWQEPGGAIAAASDTNFAMIAANQAVAPKCTTDAGHTWVDVTNAAIPAAQTTVSTGGSAGATSVTVASTVGLAGTQVIQIPMDDGRYFYTTIASVSSPTVNFTTAIPAGRSIANGANLYHTFGWLNGAFLVSHPLIADAVNGTFRAVNSLSGMITWSGCGATTLVNSGSVASGTWQSGGASNSAFKPVPGKANHLLWSTGPQGGPSGIAGNGLYQSCDGGTTMTFRLKNVFSAQVFGLGVAAPGHSYPQIEYVGWYDRTNSNTEANATFGVWRSIDNPGDCVNSGTFQQLCSDGTSGSSCPLSTTWPVGWMLAFKDISGDPIVYGPVYINTAAGAFYGVWNYLLNRDLDPAQNDNSPAWLEKAA